LWCVQPTLYQISKGLSAFFAISQIPRRLGQRPIEFSGLPKSGKTICINSLELFLKRNGFKVEIVQKRASVCPVADKKSPMFNIGTACMSITRMIASLEQKAVNCDVLILDMGIFDAFCWFDWSSKKKAASNTNKAAIENFILMDLLVNQIDIVFAFTAPRCFLLSVNTQIY
jgi:hypothetical protein